MLSLEEKKQMEEIFARYHTDGTEKRPSRQQVAFDIGWLIGLIAKLNSDIWRDRK